MADPYQYQRIRSVLEEPIQRPLMFPEPDDTECVRTIGPDPNWEPTWPSVSTRIDQMDPDIAYACALAAQDTARAMIGPEELMEETPDYDLVQRALQLAEFSLIVASGVDREPIEGSTEYILLERDPPEPSLWRRKAALAAILAYADAVATDKGFNPYDYQYSYFARLESLDHVDMYVGPRRELSLYHDPTIHDPIAEDHELWDILQDWWTSGHGLGHLDDLGSLRTDPFISEEITIIDGEAVVNSPLWYYPSHMRSDPVRELRQEGITRGWYPDYPGGELFPTLGQAGDAWHGGTTPGHKQFFDIWWRLCRCRLPSYMLD